LAATREDRNPLYAAPERRFLLSNAAPAATRTIPRRPRGPMGRLGPVTGRVGFLLMEAPRTEVDGVGVGPGLGGLLEGGLTTTDSPFSLHFVVTGTLEALPL
jgi:hypothetical protein